MIRLVTPPGIRGRWKAALGRLYAHDQEESLAAAPGGAALQQRPSRRTLLYGAGVLTLYAALTLVMTYPQVIVLQRGISAEFSDTLFSTWRLAWVAHQLPRDPARLFDANIFYPERGTLAYSDAILVPSLMAAPLLWLGVPPLLAFNILQLSTFALSGAATFLLVRSLTGHTGAALVAGFVFAFLPYRFVHYGQLELQTTQWMPLGLWALHRTLKSGRYRDGLIVGLCVALQTLSSVYYGIFFATYLTPVTAVLMLGRPAVQLWPVVRALAAGGTLAAVLVSPIARPYLAARQAVGERSLFEVKHYSATPASYLAAPPQNVTFGGPEARLGVPELQLFQGVTVPVLAIASLWPPISTARMAYTAGLLVAINVSMGFNGVGYWRLRAYVPVYRGLRVPARMAIFVSLSLSILLGFAVARLSRLWKSRTARMAAVGVVLALVCVEYRSTLNLIEVWRAPPPVYQALAAAPEAVVLELPLIAPEIALEPAYLYFSTFHWHRLVNGYSGFTPPSYRQLPEIMRGFPDEESMAEVRRRSVDWIVLHAVFYPPARYAQIVEQLAERTDVVLERIDGEFAMQETRLYRVLATAP